jgi:3-ketoacyl-CoA synthase
MEHSKASGLFDEKSLEFQRRILERSSLGKNIALPIALHQLLANPNMAEAYLESEMIMFEDLDELFEKTKVKPKDIGLLVVNCSLFNPTPSLLAMIINKYKTRSNIRSYNLDGMGCSAGVIFIDLAKDLLQIHGGSYTIVVSTENITQNLLRTTSHPQQGGGSGHGWRQRGGR